MKSLGAWGTSGVQGTYASRLGIQPQRKRTELKTWACAEEVLPKVVSPRQGCLESFLMGFRSHSTEIWFDLTRFSSA